MKLFFIILLVFSFSAQAQQYMPQVEIPIWSEPNPWWVVPEECPQVVEDASGYFEMLWDVVKGAFRFIAPSDTILVSDGVSNASVVQAKLDLNSITFAEPNVRRIMALEQKVKELEAANYTLTIDVLRLVGKELRRKDDANKSWWEANDYWEATHTALCAWLLEYQIPPGAGGGSPSWNALRKACGK